METSENRNNKKKKIRSLKEKEGRKKIHLFAKENFSRNFFYLSISFIEVFGDAGNKQFFPVRDVSIMSIIFQFYDFVEYSSAKSSTYFTHGSLVFSFRID